MKKYLHILQMLGNEMKKFQNQYIHSFFNNKFEKNHPSYVLHMLEVNMLIKVKVLFGRQQKIQFNQ